MKKKPVDLSNAFAQMQINETEKQLSTKHKRSSLDMYGSPRRQQSKGFDDFGACVAHLNDKAAGDSKAAAQQSPSHSAQAAAQEASDFYQAASAVKASSDDDCEPDSEEEDYIRFNSMNSNNRRQSLLSNPLVDLDEQIFEVDVESGSHSSSSEDHKEEV